jgi:hypothetical protein
VLESRFSDTWGKGIHLVYTLAAAIAVTMLARQTTVTGERPAGWQSVFYVASIALALLALGRLANVLGADNPFNSSGTVVWVGLLVVALALSYYNDKSSGISLLLAVIATAVVALNFVNWVFSPDGPNTFRWILLLLTVAFGAIGVMSRADRKRSVAFINGAGLTLLGLAITFALTGLAGVFSSGGASFAGAGWGWELILLIGGFALLVYSSHEAQSGPGYLGVANLLAFIALASPPSSDGASLIGWPLVLLLITGGLLAAGLRRA